MPSALRVVLATGIALPLACPPPANAQSAENIALVINDNSTASRTVGEYYAAKRNVPAANILRISASEDEEIDRASYNSTIEWPIRARISQQGLQDRILYIVLTKGVPLRIKGTPGRFGTLSSVDSELALLYRRMTGEQVSPVGAFDNPYFLGTAEIPTARTFTHRDQDLFLVTRLDGYSVEDVIALIDRASAPAADGDIVLATERPPRVAAVSDWMAATSARIAQQGTKSRVRMDTMVPPGTDRPVLGYFASSSQLNTTDPRTMVFAPGSLASRFADADARTFREPTAQRRTASDLLIGDFIRAGATGAAGFVGDPTGGSIVRPDILFPAYLAGFNLAEAFYLSMPHLSRRAVVIGDPLCAPFRRTTLSHADLEPPPDPIMEFAADFANRRLAALRHKYPNVPEAALMLSIRANAYDLRREPDTARRLLEVVTSVAPEFASAQALLAVLYDRIDNRDAAIEHYRLAVEAQPQYVRPELVEVSNGIGLMEVRQLALNNLAYDLAVYRHAPEEALPYARKALTAAPEDAELLDTVGWIEHLAGDDNNAITHLRAAVARGPQNPEIWLHAAMIAAEFDMPVEAEKDLAAAVQLDPTIGASDEAKAIKGRLQSGAFHSK